MDTKSTVIDNEPMPIDHHAFMVNGLFRFMNEDDSDSDNKNNDSNNNDLLDNLLDTTTTSSIDHHLRTRQEDIAKSSSGNTDQTTLSLLNNGDIDNNNNTSSNKLIENDKTTTRKSLDYLKELFQDRERISMLPKGIFYHLERLIDQEILRVRASLIHIDGSADERKPLTLPEPEGPIVQRTTRISIPVDKYPEHNFVGRIIGPRGLTIRELEVDCGCKFYIRGKGSFRNKEKEEKCRGLPSWEHLNEQLHVLVIAEDSENRIEIKLNYATEQINKLIQSVISQEDDFKMRQLAELAILNDKFNTKSNSNHNNNMSSSSQSTIKQLPVRSYIGPNGTSSVAAASAFPSSPAICIGQRAYSSSAYPQFAPYPAPRTLDSQLFLNPPHLITPTDLFATGLHFPGAGTFGAISAANTHQKRYHPYIKRK